MRQHLLARFGGDVAVVGKPEAISGGFDFWIYSLQFAGPHLPSDWAAPLVARIPPTAERFLQLAGESKLQAWAAAQGYPAPAVVATLAPGEVISSPVQLIARVPGITMTEAMTSRPWRIRRLIARLAELHASLHSLALPDWAGGREWSVLERRLALVRFVLERMAHPELEAGLASVERLRARLEDAEAALCHGDFHPMNVLVSATGESVIDWTDAGFGDPHCDVARTSWLFGFAAAVAPRRAERAVLRPVAPLLRGDYLRSYRRHRRIDPDRVRLWRAPHTLHAWAMIVADENELVGPSRAGKELRPSMASWAQQCFSDTMRSL